MPGATDGSNPVGSGRVFMYFYRINRTSVPITSTPVPHSFLIGTSSVSVSLFAGLKLPGCSRAIDGLARMCRVSTKAGESHENLFNFLVFEIGRGSGCIGV